MKPNNFVMCSLYLVVMKTKSMHGWAHFGFVLGHSLVGHGFGQTSLALYYNKHFHGHCLTP